MKWISELPEMIGELSGVLLFVAIIFVWICDLLIAGYIGLINVVRAS